MNNEDLLVGWKEIADHLRVSISTAKRWARRRGLPVHRLQGQIRADRKAVESWVIDHSRVRS